MDIENLLVAAEEATATWKTEGGGFATEVVRKAIWELRHHSGHRFFLWKGRYYDADYNHGLRPIRLYTVGETA